MKCFHTLLVTEPYNRFSTKQAGLRREHEHPSQEFLVVGNVVACCLIPLPVLVPKGH